MANLKASKLTNISIKETASGMFFATSEDEPTFFVSALSADDLFSAVQLALEDMYLCKYNVEAKAVPMEGSDFAHRPWALISKATIAELAA